ncbi:MAG: ABC transporter permease [Eubacterium sp.]|jgi:peptide/nickel transport system permease protein
MSDMTKAAAAVPNENISIGGHGQGKEILGRFLRNKTAIVGCVIVIFLIFCAIAPQAITVYDPYEQDYSSTFLPPSKTHFFGTDAYGRDIYTRVVYGCRTSLEIGLIAVALSCLAGTVIGAISGFYGGVVDNIAMRFIDVLMAIPNTLLGISIVAALGNSVTNLIIALAIGSVSGYARVVRVSVLSVKETEYVEAAYATGASDFRIILKYILPNCLAPIIVQATMSVATTIMAATGLSFLGLGVPDPIPEWGAMASSARAYIRDYWWLVTFPGLAIMLTAFSFNLFGDGLRDALDPKLKS